MVHLFFVGFVFANYFWSFGYGLARFEFRVTMWYENEKYQGVKSISKVHWNYEGGGRRIVS